MPLHHKPQNQPCHFSREDGKTNRERLKEGCEVRHAKDDESFILYINNSILIIVYVSINIISCTRIQLENYINPGYVYICVCISMYTFRIDFEICTVTPQRMQSIANLPCSV